MRCVRKVTGDLYWVGANDRHTPLFENIHPIPRGVSYNSSWTKKPSSSTAWTGPPPPSWWRM